MEPTTFLLTGTSTDHCITVLTLFPFIWPQNVIIIALFSRYARTIKWSRWCKCGWVLGLAGNSRMRSIPLIVGMLFHWQVLNILPIFSPSEQIIRWLITDGIMCDSFILFSTGVASQTVPGVDATPTSTHLHPGVGFPLWNSRLLFVFFSQIPEHWTEAFAIRLYTAKCVVFWTSMENDSDYTRRRVQNWEIYTPSVSNSRTTQVRPHSNCTSGLL